MSSLVASYVKLYESGELQRRTGRLESRLASCDICPRQCAVNRLEDELGFCSSGRHPVLSSYCDHHGEEPAISGIRGSGTIFFGNCNLRCLYCQNHEISQDPERQKHRETDCHGLASAMVFLQEVLHCHNINLVTPSHFVPQILRALVEAVPLGLHVPLVYNTSSYDGLDTLRELDGVVDIYLPDIKYASDMAAVKYSQAPGYVGHARLAIREMHRQVGDLVTDGDGVAVRGVIVRHLVLPNDIAGSEESLSWLAREVSENVTLSVMAQYRPCHRAPRVPLLSRTVSRAEYGRVVRRLQELRLENGWVQELDSSGSYLPDFQSEGHPFEPAGPGPRARDG